MNGRVINPSLVGFLEGLEPRLDDSASTIESQERNAGRA
jgi:hypothetical protein